MVVKGSYIFGASFAVGAVCSMVPRADGAIITAAAFTFETSGLAFSTSVTSPGIGPLVAESGIGTAFGSHTATTTVYSSPAGSGSSHSLSANSFSTGDYWEFDVPTTTISGIQINFDEVSSSTGPKVFTLDYSTGGAYSAFAIYTLNTGTVTAFATAATNSAVHFAFDMSTITALNSAPLASFRLVESDTTTATGGASRVDNFVVSGTTSAVPEPASLSIVALGLAALGGRRRK